MTNVTIQSNGNIAQPDHHDLGRLIGTISGHAVHKLDMSTSDLWTAMDEGTPIDTPTMIEPIRSNITAMRDLLNRLEAFVSEVEHQDIPLSIVV